MSIFLYSHGACREVTGSKHFLEISGQILQVDCGMFQGKRSEAYLKNRNGELPGAEVAALLLSHGHYDHSGALPILVKKGFHGNIYTTSATRDIAQIILQDSAHIQKKDYEYIQKRNSKHPEQALTLYEPLYDTDDVTQTMEHFVSIGYHRPFFPLPQVAAQFFDAGHILGSTLIHIQANGLRIGFSGDLGRSKLPIIRDPEILPACDYLVLEGTYGNRLHKPFAQAEEELIRIIQQIYQNKGKIIIPAFTIERTQELIYLIHNLRREQRIPDVPIFIDSPMAINATAIFKIHSECFDTETRERFIAANIDPFGFDGIHYVNSTNESIQLNSRSGPAIIISASGMAESGRILHHLANNIEDPRNIIAIVGYMAENTLGRRLAERQPEVKIFGRRYRVNAQIATLNSFSAHADWQEICAWIKRHDLQTLKKIFLVHGEPDALQNLQIQLMQSGVRAVEISDCGKRYPLT